MINLIFDVDDTLYDQIVPFGNAVNTVFGEDINIPSRDLFKANRKHSESVFKFTEDGSLSIGDMHVYRITKAFEDFGINITVEKAKDFQKEYVNNQGKIKLLDNMKDVLDFGKDNDFTMGIITNGPGEHQGKKVKTLELNKWIAEENVFISGSVNISKPDVEIFKLVEEKMNLEPKNTYYIGDSINNDVVGAKRAGWNMIWINRREDIIPENMEFYPDYTIKDDKELVRLLKQITLFS